MNRVTDYIKRKAAIKVLCDNCKRNHKSCEGVNNEECYEVTALSAIPAADVREVVYCRDCKWTKTDGMDDPAIYCAKWDKWEMPNDGFCWLGRRR